MNPIKHLRVVRGMTQFELGRLLGISESQVSKVETGRSRLDSRSLEKLVSLFELDEKTLLEIVGSFPYISPKEKGDL